MHRFVTSSLSSLVTLVSLITLAIFAAPQSSHAASIHAAPINSDPTVAPTVANFEPPTTPSTSAPQSSLPSPSPSSPRQSSPLLSSAPSPSQSSSAALMPSPPDKLFTDLPSPKLKSPLLAASLSGLFPGLGHVYLGDYSTAGEFAVASGLSFGSSQSEGFHLEGLTVLQNIWMYGIYAAYRDARIHRCDAGYLYKMPTDSFVDLSMAPFRPRVLKKFEVWGGLVGLFALAAVINKLVPKMTSQSVSEVTLNPVVAFPVGIGEETLFRGYLQSQFTETFNPWGGVALSTLLFTAAHIPNASLLPRAEQVRYYSCALPFIGAFGAYTGWLTYKNHSLQESIALHSWFDFIVFLAGAAAQSEQRVKFTTSIGF